MHLAYITTILESIDIRIEKSFILFSLIVIWIINS